MRLSSLLRLAPRLTTDYRTRRQSAHMTNLGALRGKAANSPAAATTHRCSLCHQELHLIRRHVSPARLGDPVTTEFYQCSACDSGFALDVATGKWKRWLDADS